VKVAHSIISEDWIANYVIERYDLQEGTACKYLCQGLNDSYLLTDGTKKYIFRLYRRLWRTLEKISAEVDLLLQLERYSAPIAGVVHDRDEKLIQSLACPEGERFGILMHCAANTQKESHCIVTGNAYQYGKAMAKLHNALKRCKPPEGVATLNVDHLIWKPVTLAEQAFPDNKKELHHLREFALQLAQKIDTVGTRASKQLIHGDLTGGNACIDDDGSYVFFDFDCCGYGWTAYDLAVFLWSATLNGKDKILWPEFMNGYRSEAGLKDQDLALVPLLVAARNCWIMGYSIGQVGVKGSLSYKNHDFIRDLGFLKAWKNQLP
jgi:Ser/Thr protein kinase RdoA (MazF antagonist)